LDDLHGNKITPDMIPTSFKAKPGYPGFATFMDNLSFSDFKQAMSDSAIATKVDDLLRGAGGLHEGIPVSSYRKHRDKFDLKITDVTQSQVPITDMQWRFPSTGEKGMHGAKGSTTYHKEIFKVFKTATTKNELNQMLQDLGKKWETPVIEMKAK